jgi:hypothetical protein
MIHGFREESLMNRDQFWLTGNPSVSTAGQAGRLRFVAGFGAHDFASTSTLAASASASIALGSNSTPSHSSISAWRSCSGSLRASRKSA